MQLAQDHRGRRVQHAARREQASHQGGDHAERATGGGHPPVGFPWQVEGLFGDDTSQYRADNEGACWPGGDPIERLKRHLVGLGEWSEEAHKQLDTALEQEAIATFEHAEAYGSLAKPSEIAPAAMFEDVYVKTPDHLQRQFEELQAENHDQDRLSPTVPFAKPQHRAVG